MSIDFITNLASSHEEVIKFPWKCKIASFEKYYDKTEICHIKDGKAKIWLDNERCVTANKGDVLKIYKGTHCKWEIIEDIYKEYYYEK